MKKLIGIALSLAMVATLSFGPVGCGKKKEDTTGVKKEPGTDVTGKDSGKAPKEDAK